MNESSLFISQSKRNYCLQLLNGIKKYTKKHSHTSCQPKKSSNVKEWKRNRMAKYQITQLRSSFINELNWNHWVPKLNRQFGLFRRLLSVVHLFILVLATETWEKTNNSCPADLQDNKTQEQVFGCVIALVITNLRMKEMKLKEPIDV